MPQIKFTHLQAAEMCHKFGIIADEPDLQDSYGITSEQANQMFDTFWPVPREGAVIDVPQFAIDPIIGEAENLIDIAISNLDTEENQMRVLSYISSMRGLIEKCKPFTE